MKLNHNKVKEGLDTKTGDAKSFTRQPTLPPKKQLKLQSFKFDEETRQLLDEIADQFCGGNKTLAVKAAILAFSEVSFDARFDAVMKANK